MMKKIGLLLFTISLCFLIACNAKWGVEGRIVETNVEENTGLTSFVVRTDDEKEVGIALTDETIIYTFVDGITVEDFKKGSFSDITVSVEYRKPQRTITTEDNQKIAVYNANRVEVTGVLTSETTELSDGTKVEIWNSPAGTGYRLTNGIELLRARKSEGPKDYNFFEGTESLKELNKEAQKNIIEFYRQQGELYDVPAELEKAYHDYCNQKDNIRFQTHHVSQEVVPTASGKSVIYFRTSVMLPVFEGLSEGLSATYREDSTEGELVYYEYYTGAAFDKETGEVIDNWNLFSCSPEKAIETILEIADVSSALRKEMKASFEPENMVFFPDSLEVNFPQGTLPSQENSYILGLDYDERLLGILNEWAVPESKE